MISHKLSISAAVLMLAAVSAPASAHHLEPINTEYAQPFEPGVGSFKFGYDHNAFDAFREDGLDGELELGIAHRLQFSVGQGYVWQNGGGGRQRSGLTNLETSLSYLVAGGTGHPYAVSVSPSYEAVTGGRAVREGIPSYGLELRADYQQPGWLFFSNLGYNQASRAQGSDPRDRQVFYHLAAVHPISYRWNPTLELLGTQDIASGRHHVVLVPEIQYFQNAWVELKLGVPIQVTQGAGRMGVQLQATFSLGKGSHG